MHLQLQLFPLKGLLSQALPYPFALHLKIIVYSALLMEQGTCLNQNRLGLSTHFKHYIFVTPAHQLASKVFFCSKSSL